MRDGDTPSLMRLSRLVQQAEQRGGTEVRRSSVRGPRVMIEQMRRKKLGKGRATDGSCGRGGVAVQVLLGRWLALRSRRLCYVWTLPLAWQVRASMGANVITVVIRRVRRASVRARNAKRAQLLARRRVGDFMSRNPGGQAHFHSPALSLPPRLQCTVRPL